ncbi:hypothetical protein ACF3DV_11185 [Chlorogloeopsis fritschii PCC 9212]|nr:hypothetical protein [Chlorogloeopsis fritschii]
MITIALNQWMKNFSCEQAIKTYLKSKKFQFNGIEASQNISDRYNLTI